MSGKTFDPTMDDAADVARGGPVGLPKRYRESQRRALKQYQSELPKGVAEENERLRKALSEVRAFLAKPEWSTWRYMEGEKIYEDRIAALCEIDRALASTTDASE